ncbi:TAXI family TRAP transporter solute-binding subunit [Leucobacter salsicius]|uniref:TAXI family TRAP transporter solute-binding subunit n=1 Tax=Leucobacter salsicius TaxID=664638 RepID=UPI00034D3718|nr:TAXI family TRAP transporter solute-binding subunit [Leucobacter salsicius]
MKRGWRVTVAAAVIALLGGLVGCGSGSPTATGPYVVAGGGKAGVYFTYAEQLALAASQSLNLDVTAAQTQGSVDNLQRVASGEALVGFAQGDTAADAISGTGAFAEPLPITALARVYDEYVHVVVPEDSDVHSIADLAGHTVSLGSEGSGVQVIATRVLEAAGVDPAEVPGPALGLDTSLGALKAGEIEAFFWVGGLPTPGIERMAKELPIRLLEVDTAIVERVNEGHAGVYRTAEFPENTYGVDRVTATMAVPNYLVASEAAPPELIRNIVRVLFEARTTIAAEVRAAALLDQREAIFTEPVPLHPGAAEYYRASRL